MSRERLGRYEVEGVIGRGGYATVYRAHDPRLDATVAVKVLAENHSLDPDLRERFIGEGHLLRRIGSPHLVAVHDLGETDRGQPYLVLDHADRGDLRARVDALAGAGRHPGGVDVLVLARFLAAALRRVHACDVVHRDLSPGNVLVRSRPPRAAADATVGQLVAPDEELVLADLGLSKDLARHSGLTAGTGTSGFTPPEQREGAGRVDQRADIWAASALLVWLLTGGAPDARERWREELRTREVPPALTAALGGGLAEAPSDRQEDVDAWLGEVEAALAAGPATALVVPSGPGAPTGSVASAGPRPRRPLRIASAALLLVALGALGGLLVPRLVTTEASVVALDDGRVRAVSPGGTVAIVGPATLDVGAIARYQAEIEDLEHWVWIAPDGQAFADVGSLEVGASSPGVAVVRLLAFDAAGRRAEALLRVDVVE